LKCILDIRNHATDSRIRAYTVRMRLRYRGLERISEGDLRRSLGTVAWYAVRGIPISYIGLAFARLSTLRPPLEAGKA
jgi:hypothetical protein